MDKKDKPKIAGNEMTENEVGTVNKLIERICHRLKLDTNETKIVFEDSIMMLISAKNILHCSFQGKVKINGEEHLIECTKRSGERESIDLDYIWKENEA